jgi:o-succinylbenzoate synthase
MLLPPLPDLLASARVVAIPLVRRFRRIDVREAVVFEGPEGWTEFSPFAEYDDDEAATWLRAAIGFGWTASPAPRRDAIPVNATVPAVGADDVPAVLARFPGCRTAKVKVADGGQHLTDDVARVAAVRRALGPEGRVRVDANGRWSIDEAERAVHALERFDLEYVEQPCATLAELVELRERIRDLDIPVAADESVRRADDPLRVAREGAADLLVIKAQPLGGVARALRVVAEAGLPAIVSSALDTSVGLAMGAALAAALPDLDYDCGLGTSALFVDDVADPPLRAENGMLPVTRATPAPDRLHRLAADDVRRAWWLDRLARCHTLLEREEEFLRR